ncbi:hypothetical protein RchiOBHm_Chr5g0044781 [Rosa chinensis]|uniref:Uncharacterized protein n=1 Tax=Rosa chinensis TaxID=74649 RepID=A0A2P6QDN2_ROSCH|nr:hypothetical protein RchiOBHm_Chr5g0044781 [Rosa chinensis]
MIKSISRTTSILKAQFVTAKMSRCRILSATATPLPRALCQIDMNYCKLFLISACDDT